jgi:hypothetical protein
VLGSEKTLDLHRLILGLTITLGIDSGPYTPYPKRQTFRIILDLTNRVVSDDNATACKGPAYHGFGTVPSTILSNLWRPALNVLTKVFVVLTTILSVVLVSLVIPFVANTEKFRDQRDAAKLETAAARADNAVLQLQVDATRSELNTQLDDVQKLLTAQRTLNDSLKGDVTTARGDLERTRADLVRTQADIANLTAAAAQFAKIQEDLQKELAARREETTKQAKSIIELDAANNDLNSIRATLTRQLRLAQENLAKTQQELAEQSEILKSIPKDYIANLNKGGTVTADDDGISPEVVIIGQVSDAKQVGDTTLVQLNIGTTGGVKERMKFLVHREGQYLGTLIITQVDEQNSIGRIKTLKSGASIKVGDAARAGPIN